VSLGRGRGLRIAALLLAAAALAVGVIGGVGLGLRSTRTVAGPVPQFVDQTDSSGVAFIYDGPLEYSVGAGVAVLDCDADGRPDLYLAGGAEPAGLFRNESPRGGPVRFTRDDDSASALTSVTGAYPIDVDGDRLVDLVVLRIGGNVVLRGLGDCRFERANEAWSLDGGHLDTMAFSATWEPGSTWPTLAFGNYVDQKIEDPTHWCEPNQLVRPESSDARGWASPSALTPAWCTLSLLFSSWDGSGRMDLRVSNDRHYYPATLGQEQLWRIDPGQAPRLYTAADGWTDVNVEGMGIASYDLTGDGLPEVYLTSQAANHLMTLSSGASEPAYRDIGLDRGTNVPHPLVGDVALPSTAWHPEFADVNNDGLIDLFVSKGNVSAQADYAQKDPSNLLLGQPNGTFVESTAAASLVRFERGRGAALVDLDLDGRLDLVESFYRDPVRIWRNTAPAADPSAVPQWLALRLRQAGPNIDAVGALVELHAGGAVQRREMTIGGGHAGGQLGWTHFGLGAANRADVRVRWPDGTWSATFSIAAGGFTILDRDAGSQPWVPGSAP
jgi:hypothetical protein